jgi:formylmethanofuran dehydrogenase subunit D
MPTPFILTPGRTSRQGTTLNEGKYTDGYIDEISVMQMSPADMQKLGLAEGDRVRMWNDTGEVTVAVKAARGDELPEGMLFISYGDISSQLMGLDTHGSGMPDSKGLDVWVEPA